MAASWAARRRLPLFRSHPARVTVGAFALAVVIGTTLLALPVSTAGDRGTDLVTALFTATSAVCVTGLITVDTGTYWSGFGQGVILALIQVGGFGIMTLASLLALLVSGKLRLRMQLTAQAETKSFGIGEVRRVLRGVAATTFVVECVVAVILLLRFRFGYGLRTGEAVWQGVFTAVSAFNTPASACTPTTSPGSPATRGCCCPWPPRSSWAGSASRCCWRSSSTGGDDAPPAGAGGRCTRS